MAVERSAFDPVMSRAEETTGPERPAPPAGGAEHGWPLVAIAVILAFAVLWLARVFLIPLAIALLLFALTSAAIDMLTRIRLGRFFLPGWLASVIVVLAIAALLLGLLGVVLAQIDAIVATSSTYIDRGGQALSLLFAWLGEDVAAAVVSAFREIDFGSYLRAFAGSAGSFLSSTILVILYVGFLYAERPWFARKLANLVADERRKQDVRDIVVAITASVRHYMLVKTAISLVTALAVYVVLRAFGLDFAEALAISTFALNFIPNIGSIIATLLPALVALAQFGDWSMVLLVLLTTGIVQFGIGNVVDPMLMGRALHLSSLAVILSLTFWGAIWGVVGLFLAVPIMVVVLIVATHVPRLRPLAILLSRDGAPPPAARS